MNHQLRVLALGDTRHGDFRSAIESIENDKLAEFVNDEQPVELVLYFQAKPSTGNAKQLDQLRSRMPLTGFAVVLGTWCEGETRTGTPLQHAERLFWYQFPAWWQDVRDRWSHGEPAHWQYLDKPPLSSEHNLAGKLIAVDAAEYETAETIINSIEQMGGHGVWQPRWQSSRLSSQVAAGVWIGAQLDLAEEQQLSIFRSQLPADAPLVVLLDFPRLDRVQFARQLGATHVLGKPWRFEHLVASLGWVS